MPTISSAWQQLYALISDHQRTHPGTTSQQAMTAVLDQHQDLAQAIRALERQGQRPPEHLVRKQVPGPLKKVVQASDLLLNKITKLAQARLDAGTSPTLAQAMDAVIVERPGLYQEYRTALREERTR